VIYLVKKKEVQGDYGQLASLGQILKDIEFPANKNQIVEFVKFHNADQNILQQLQNIEEKEYQNSAEVTAAAWLKY
jgi:methionine salvage enolase-phosphatase E1